MNKKKDAEMMIIRNEFEKLIGDDELNMLENYNWIEYRRKPIEIYKVNDIDIKFLEKDGKSDIVIFLTFTYNEDDKVWFSSNNIDSPDVPFDTYKDMVNHYKSLEDAHIDNGSSVAEID